MAVNDPTMGVPTPTGVLQGVAIFNWDGATWQPSGRAGPSVATPTGVLQGVAAFSGSPPQPTGRATPGVATPTGVLDGVAVYTWSGAQWTPSGGAPTPSTPSGALRGVAAFDWDGAQWQPAGQAGPDVATPYGVLQGVARFNWTGSAWAAVGAPSLSLDFMTPGALDPRITFTRASTATYTDAGGTIRTAATNAPRWDYDPVTLALKGLLLEEARTNLAQQSGNLANAPWAPGAGVVALPVVTANQAVAPDGTSTAARIVYPAVIGAGAVSVVQQNINASANPHAFSVWLKGAVGGEQLYINANIPPYYTMAVTLTTQWQRFTLLTPALTAAGWWFAIGIDLRDVGQTTRPAQTIYAWGAQVEAGAFATSYISTTSAAVTRAIDQCATPFNGATWFSTISGAWFAEFIPLSFAAAAQRVLWTSAANSPTPMYADATAHLGQYDIAAFVLTANTMTANTVHKGATSWTSGSAKACLNGGAVATSAALTTGYGALASATLYFLQGLIPGEATSGYIRRVQYWPRALSDAEARQVTT